MDYIADIRSLATQIIALIDANDTPLPIDQPPPPPVSTGWWHTLNGANPHYDADFVGNRYFANAAERAYSELGFIGNRVLGGDGLVMGQSKNRVANSNDFTSWNKSNVTIANGVMTDNSVSGLHETWIPVTIASGSTNTYSLEVKAGTLSKFRLWGNRGGTGIYVDVDLVANTATTGVNTVGVSTVSGATLAVLPDGYTRVTVSGIVGNGIVDPFIILSLRNNAGSRTYAGTGGTLLIRNAQVESGSSFTEYQENIGGTTSLIKSVITAPSAITRVIYATTAATLPVDQYQVLHHLDNNVNTANGYSDVEDYRGANGNIFIESKSLSTTVIGGRVDVGHIPNSTFFKLAYTASASGIVHSLNGGSPVSTPIASWPSGLTQNRLNGNITGIRQWGGSLARDTLFFGTATGAQLQAMSA